MKKLSETQRDALTRMARTGKALVRWPGGFWTIEGCDKMHSQTIGHDVPVWYCGVATVTALERLGMIEIAPGQDEVPLWRAARALSDQGRAAAAA